MILVHYQDAAFPRTQDDATPTGVMVEIVDADGTAGSLPLNRFGVIPPAVPAYMLKSKEISRALNADPYKDMTSPYERMMQSFEMPLAAYAAQDAAFDPTGVSAIRFRFDGSAAGKMYLDQVGFSG